LCDGASPLGAAPTLIKEYSPMPDFPVQVLRADGGDYVASLVDLTDGPLGHGIDPYAAYEDLVEPALQTLRGLSDKGALPAPSAIDDRPVISFDQNQGLRKPIAGSIVDLTDQREQNPMICYSWTNVTVFQDG